MSEQKGKGFEALEDKNLEVRKGEGSGVRKDEGSEVREDEGFETLKDVGDCNGAEAPVAGLVLETERLILRPMVDAEDLPALARLCADPLVMRYFAKCLSLEESRELLLRNCSHFSRHGMGLFAVFLKSEHAGAGAQVAIAETNLTADKIGRGAGNVATTAHVRRSNGGAVGAGRGLIGFVGLMHVGEDMPFAPVVEIGWRFLAEYWGQGYACEAARAVLKFGFEAVGLPEIVAFTALVNEPSQRLMQRLGMRRDAEGDFDHPRLEAGHPLVRHCLYRIGPAGQ